MDETSVVAVEEQDPGLVHKPAVNRRKAPVKRDKVLCTVLTGDAEVSNAKSIVECGAGVNLQKPSKGKAGEADAGSTDFQETTTDIALIEGCDSAIRLVNFLSQEPCRDWVTREFFCSSNDESCLKAGQSFSQYLLTQYPQLQTRELNRAQWNSVRSRLGKPRRLSVGFFQRERQLLKEKQEKFRLLQLGQNKDVTFLSELPEDIPAPITVGSKVAVVIPQNHDGLHFGTVEAIGRQTKSYRIAFDNRDLPNMDIPDTCVVTVNPLEAVPTTLLQDREKVLLTPAGFRHKLSKNTVITEASLVGFHPAKSIITIVRTVRLLTSKRKLLDELDEQNRLVQTTLPSLPASTHCTPDDYLKQYAKIMVLLEDVNEQLGCLMEKAKAFVEQLKNSSKAPSESSSYSAPLHSDFATKAVDLCLQSSIKGPGRENVGVDFSFKCVEIMLRLGAVGKYHVANSDVKSLERLIQSAGTELSQPEYFYAKIYPLVDAFLSSLAH